MTVVCDFDRTKSYWLLLVGFFDWSKQNCFSLCDGDGGGGTLVFGTLFGSDLNTSGGNLFRIAFNFSDSVGIVPIIIKEFSYWIIIQLLRLRSKIIINLSDPMAGGMLDFHPSNFTQLDDGFLLVFTTDENYSQFYDNITNDYVVSQHTGDFCKKAHCKYHIMLYSAKLWEHLLDALVGKNGSYLRVDASYYYFKFFIICEELILQHGLIFKNLSEAIKYNRTHPFTDTSRPSDLKKKLLRKVSRSFPYTKPDVNKVTSIEVGCQATPTALMRRIQFVLESSNATALAAIVDCFIDNNGHVDNDTCIFLIK